MLRVLLCMLEAVGCEIDLLEVLVSGVLEVMRCILLCTPEAVEGELCLLEVLEIPNVVEVPDVMRCVLLCMLEAVDGEIYLLDVLDMLRGDATGAALYAGGCEG